MKKDIILAIIITAAVVGVFGFGSGALLTRPSRTEKQDAVNAVKLEKQNALSLADSEISNLKENSRALMVKNQTLQKNNNELTAELDKLKQTAKTVKENSVVSDKSASKKTEESFKIVEESIQKLLDEGFVHSVNVEFNEVRANTATWDLLALEQKQQFVAVFSNYFDAKGSTGRVTVLSNRNDSKLATYSVWSGIKIIR